MNWIISKTTILALFFLLSSCSLWQQDRRPSTEESQKSLAGPVQFNAYHNIRPSRRSGGKDYQINFLTPKALKEISFEFVNHKVKIHDIRLIKSSGEFVPLKGFQSRSLGPRHRHLSLRNLSDAHGIQAVRLKAEGYEDNDVLFTVSFFSPDGFVPEEQGRSVALSRLDPEAKKTTHQKLPNCLIQNARLSPIIFDGEQLRSLSDSERRYFCRDFVPRLEELVREHKNVSLFLRTGENLEKPLVKLGGSFSYDPHKNQLHFPFRLKKEQYPEIAQRLESFYKRSGNRASRGLSQQEETRYGLQQSYEEYMNSAEGPELSYLEEQESGGNVDHQRECLQRLVELGIYSSQAKGHCQDAIGYELEHASCVEFLSDQYVLVGNAHHYCLEAQGKLSEYKPCMEKLMSLDMNHYDSNLFCQKTPSEYMQSQLSCVQEMIDLGQSQYSTVRTCQKHWGKERRFISCLRELSQSHDAKKAVQLCNAR